MASNITRTAAIVALGGFIFGFDASVISGAIGFLIDEYGLNDWQVGLVVGAPTLGGIISGISSAPLSDRIGRLTVLKIIAALYLVSAVMSAFAPSFEALVMARFIGGLAFASLGIAPIYISEIAPAEKRGQLVSFNQMNIVIGFAVAYFANYWVLGAANSTSSIASTLMIDTHTWRWMLGLEIVPAFAYLLLLYRLPESPRWYALHGQIDRAKQVLQQLHGKQAALDASWLSTHDRMPLWHRVKALFGKPMQAIIAVGILIAIAQQVTGINAIYFYAPTIFELSGVGENAAFAQATYIGIVNIVFTLIAMATIDRWGRKPLLMLGLTGIMISMAICSYGFGSATYLLNDADIAQLLVNHPVDASLINSLSGVQYTSDIEFKQAIATAVGASNGGLEGDALKLAINANSQLILFGILGFVASFAVSLGPVMWVYLPEIFPDHLRGVGMALTGVMNSVASFTVQFVFPWELSTLGTATTFGIYSALAIVSLILVGAFMRETKGQQLQVQAA